MTPTGLRASEICTHPVVSVDKSTSLRDVARLMRKRHIGDVVITEGVDHDEKAIGVLTDRDLVIHGLALDLDFESVTAADLSALELTTVTPDADLHEIVATMNKAAVRRVLVADDRRHLGVVSLDDVLWALSVIVSNLPALTERQIDRETHRFSALEA